MIAGKRKEEEWNKTLKGKKWHSSNKININIHIKSFLIVGTFSGSTPDLHPFMVIFVTIQKVHMPSPFRTPGRRLDRVVAVVIQRVRNESRGLQSKLSITRINFLALVVPIFNLAEAQNCSTFVRKKQISYFIITVFRRVLRHVSLPFPHVLLPQLCPVHVPPVCELEFEGICDRRLSPRPANKSNCPIPWSQ